MTTETNDDIIFVLFGQDYPKQNFSIEAREFKKIKDWMKKWELDSLDLYSDIVYYKIAENITPFQMNKFVGLYEYEQAKKLMIEHEFGREDYDSYIKEVLQEKKTQLIRSGALGQPNEEEMNECEICGCNMTEENTRYVEDGDTIIMCDKCEE